MTSSNRSQRLYRLLPFGVVYLTLTLAVYATCTICLTINPNLNYTCNAPSDSCCYTNGVTPATYYKLGSSSSTQQGIAGPAITATGVSGVGSCYFQSGTGNYLGNPLLCAAAETPWTDTGFSSCLSTNYCPTP